MSRYRVSPWQFPLPLQRLLSAMAKRSASPPSSPRITKRASAEPTEALSSDASSSAKMVSPISPWLYSWFKPSNELPTPNVPPSPTRANLPSSSNVNLSISTPSNNHSSGFNLPRTNTASTSVSSAPSSSSSFSPLGSQDTDIFEPRNTTSTLARPKLVGHALPLGIGPRKIQPNGGVHRRRRHHIHHDIYKSSIKESLRQELIKLNVQKGYSLPEAYDYLGYRERIARLEASEILSR
ncbi:hypothetical protein BS47DRAFT_639669 [Hydnum rufescens UP504]|uniref:Uncharacterized protein n=1 Tax=Hydnum rufescens UP504 TaxID=1448309 RepID=A0A9P6BAY5_9AGAM|nr:hypothetical protein BS47DRAFT_639669 [Hydnum rufescens UP504]